MATARPPFTLPLRRTMLISSRSSSTGSDSKAFPPLFHSSRHQFISYYSFTILSSHYFSQGADTKQRDGWNRLPEECGKNNAYHMIHDHVPGAKYDPPTPDYCPSPFSHLPAGMSSSTLMPRTRRALPLSSTWETSDGQSTWQRGPRPTPHPIGLSLIIL